MIITIDGPAASGKSTLARILAEQRNYKYINSGLLFRAVAYVLMHQENLDTILTISSQEIKALFDSGILKYHSVNGEADIFSNKEKVTHHLKTAHMDQAASVIATNPAVRQALLEYQRELAANNDIIADGRDCGSVVFPKARYKFYVTASLLVRSQRWHKDHPTISLEECKRIIEERDYRDTNRPIAPLKHADDAFIIDTSHMTIQEAINSILEVMNLK